MLRLLSFSMILFSSVAVFGQDLKNLLKPFNKAESWNLEQHSGAEASLKVTNDSAIIDCTKLATAEWHIQVFQTDIDLKEGQEYTVKAKLSSSKRRSLKLIASIGQDDWHEIGLHEDLSIDMKERTFEFTFRAFGVAAKKNRIGFMLGDERGDVIIKDMTLTEKPKS